MEEIWHLFVSVSERASKLESKVKQTWRLVFLLPKFLYYINNVGFASCTTLSVLCKSFQRTLFSSPSDSTSSLVLLEQWLLLESGCKGMTFSRISKTFEEKSWIFVIVLTFICKIRRFPWAYTLYYIRAGVRCGGGANVCGCSRRPHPRKGCTLPYPASLRNFYTCTRRHRGEMSLTERDAGAALWHYRRLGSATMTGNRRKSMEYAKGQWSQMPVMEWPLRRLEHKRATDAAR